MELTINVNLTIQDGRTINRILDAIAQLENKTMAALDALEAAVARETTVINSAIILLQQLSAAITAAGTDPVALKAITDNLNTNTDALAAAVLANTPADPVPAG